MALGVVAAACFATSFVLNREMSVAGGSWLWSASLRYLFMLPPLVLLVWIRGGLPGVVRSLRARPGAWLGWSTVGFGLFYAPLTWASQEGAGWLLAATWQLVIVAGIVIGGRVPGRTLAVSLLIVAGVALAQTQNAHGMDAGTVARVVVPVLVAAVAYPLGNRKLLGRDGLDGVQRTLAMTLGSLPLWVALAATAGLRVGAPGRDQVVQCLIVALASGVVATTLFFRATDLVRDRPAALGAVEATQAAEVPFTLAGEALVTGIAPPTPTAWTGLALIVGGLCLHALHQPPAVEPEEGGEASKAAPEAGEPPGPRHPGRAAQGQPDRQRQQGQQRQIVAVSITKR